MKYYTCKQALSYNTPFIFTLGNRGIGKTFANASRVANMFIKSRRKFIYMRRYDDDLKKTAPSFFDSIAKKYTDHSYDMSGNGKSGSVYYIDDLPAGICVALSCATKYKSAAFDDYDTIFFDEFLPEDSKYLPNEVGLALNFYQSVARGFNKPIREDVRFIFAANNVTLNNPYFRELKIRDVLQLDAKYTVDPDRAWVVEMTNNEAIAEEIAKTPFGKMIAKTKYGEYALKGQYLLDDATFIQKPSGESKYYCTLSWKGKNYGVYEYTNQGLFYVTRKANMAYPVKFSLTTDDHKPNYIMLYRNNYNPVFHFLKYAYDNALLRFDSDDSKFMFIEFMSYTVK